MAGIEPIVDQPLQQKLAEAPFAQPRIRVDMADFARVGELATPELGQTPGAGEADIGIVAAGGDDRGEGQDRLGRGAEADQTAIHRAAVDLRRGDEQGAQHLVMPFRRFEGGPPGDGMAAKAVRGEHDRAAGPGDRMAEIGDPGVALRCVPTAKVNPMAVGKRFFPQALPMVRAAVQQAGDGEDGGRWAVRQSVNRHMHLQIMLR